MSTPALSHRLSAFTSRLSCSRTEEFRCIFPCSSLVTRRFAIKAVLSKSCWQGRSECRFLMRQLSASGLNSRRLISSGVRAEASQSYSDAELDPRGDGDRLVRVISKDAEVSLLSLVATDVVREAQQRHNASPTACAALGRALMGTLLLGALKGNAETVQVTFYGDGPLGQMTAVSGDEGYVRGFVGNPLMEPIYNENGKLSVGLAVGTGVLSVVRNNRNWKQPYTGTVPIYSGEVAEDLAHYLADSEQMNSALGLGVGFDKKIGIKFAGGFLVQILPFCSDQTLTKLEENIMKMRPLSDASSDCKASDIVEAILDGIGVGDYNHAVMPRYGPCGIELLRPRMLRAVASLGPAEVQEILDEQGSVEVRCEYCGDVAQFKEADLQEALQSSSS